MIIEEIEAQLVKKPPTNLVELCHEYRTSSWYLKLSPRTKTEYEVHILALLNSAYGLKPLSFITPRMADVMYAQVVKQRGEHEGRKFVAVWHRIYEFADKYGYADRNPFRKVQVVVPPPRKIFWTEDQVFTVIETALKNGKKSLAVAVCLLYDTGQRPSDVLYLTYGSIKQDKLGWYVDFTQRKTGAQVKPALSQYTLGLLGGPEAVAARAPEDLVVENYKNLQALEKDFANLRAALGFEKIQLRDLRRTAITEMGEASDDIMISVSGHSDRDMLNVYSLRSRHKALEAQRIRHVSRNSRLNTEFTSPSGAEEAV